LFVYSSLSNFSAIWRLSSLPVIGLQIYTYAYHLWLLAVKVLLNVTPVATRDLGLYSLIQKTSTNAPQRGLNSQHKDQQNFTIP
jgi:hypothetical protein